MNLSMSDGVPTPVIVGVLVIAAAGGLAYLIFASEPDTGSPEVHYPYWCDHCGAIYDVDELKKDYPKNWRIAPGGGSDSVVICIKCNKGKAYPAAPCPTCGRRYVRHLIPDSRCPFCHPEVAEKARQAGVNLDPPGLNK